MRACLSVTIGSSGRYVAGEKLVLNYAVENNSSYDVAAVQVCLVQTFEWTRRAREQKRFKAEKN